MQQTLTRVGIIEKADIFAIERNRAEIEIPLSLLQGLMWNRHSHVDGYINI